MRALVLDFGGVLTDPILPNLDDMERDLGLEAGSMVTVLVDAYKAGGDDSAVAQLERGELSLPDFEALLSTQLGLDAPARIAGSIFGDLRIGGKLWSAAQLLRAGGVRTALLSNSWGTDGYPTELLHRTFDVLVISGEVGLRKPDPAIFELTSSRLDVPLDECVFVDDHPANLAAAADLGMATVLHRGDHDEALAEIAEHFDVDLSASVEVEHLP